MSEQDIRELLGDARAGRLSRRAFGRALAGLGLGGSLASQMLAAAGMAQAQTRPVFTPAKRGGGGALKALWWDAPTLLNPLLAVGLKDWNACGVFYEPLVAFDPAGNMVPVLAQEVVIQSGIVVPIALRAKAAAMSNRLRGVEHNAYDLDFWNLPFWYREG